MTLVRLENADPVRREFLLGVPVDYIDVQGILKRIDFAARRKTRLTLLYANAHLVNLCQDLPWLKEIINDGDIVFCDGFGVAAAAKLLYGEAPPRLTPPDWIEELIGLCARQGYKCFFLGSEQGVAERVRELMCERHPAFQVVGVHHGYFDKNIDSKDSINIIRAINGSGADILLIGFGMPLQEKWLNDHSDKLQVPVLLTVGAMFDYVAGNVKRGPRWLTDSGFEWAARLLVEPKRLWRRYIIGLPLFGSRILRLRFLRSNIKSQ